MGTEKYVDLLYDMAFDMFHLWNLKKIQVKPSGRLELRGEVQAENISWESSDC